MLPIRKRTTYCAVYTTRSLADADPRDAFRSQSSQNMVPFGTLGMVSY